MDIMININVKNIDGKKKIITNETGEQVDVEALLISTFNPEKGEEMPCIIFGKDDRYENMEFTIENARLILSQRMRGYFITKGGVRVKIYNTSLVGDFPIIGATEDNHPGLWNSKGQSSDGNEDMNLEIIIRKA